MTSYVYGKGQFVALPEKYRKILEGNSQQQQQQQQSKFSNDPIFDRLPPDFKDHILHLENENRELQGQMTTLPSLNFQNYQNADQSLLEYLRNKESELLFKLSQRLLPKQQQNIMEELEQTIKTKKIIELQIVSQKVQQKQQESQVIKLPIILNHPTMSKSEILDVYIKKRNPILKSIAQQQSSFDPIKGFTLWIDQVVALPWEVGVAKVYFGLFEKGDEFHIQFNAPPNLVSLDTYKTCKCKIQFRHSYTNISIKPNTVIYFELYLWYKGEEALPQNVNLKCWSMHEVFNYDNALITGYFRLPLYDPELDKQLLFTQSLPYYTDSALQIRICIEKSPIDYPLEIPSDSDYVIQNFHLKGFGGGGGVGDNALSKKQKPKRGSQDNRISKVIVFQESSRPWPKSSLSNNMLDQDYKNAKIVQSTYIKKIFQSEGLARQNLLGVLVSQQIQSSLQSETNQPVPLQSDSSLKKKKDINNLLSQLSSLRQSQVSGTSKDALQEEKESEEEDLNDVEKEVEDGDQQGMTILLTELSNYSVDHGKQFQILMSVYNKEAFIKDIYKELCNNEFDLNGQQPKKQAKEEGKKEKDKAKEEGKGEQEEDEEEEDEEEEDEEEEEEEEEAPTKEVKKKEEVRNDLLLFMKKEVTFHINLKGLLKKLRPEQLAKVVVYIQIYNYEIQEQLGWLILPLFKPEAENKKQEEEQQEEEEEEGEGKPAKQKFVFNNGQFLVNLRLPPPLEAPFKNYQKLQTSPVILQFQMKELSFEGKLEVVDLSKKIDKKQIQQKNQGLKCLLLFPYELRNMQEQVTAKAVASRDSGLTLSAQIYTLDDEKNENLLFDRRQVKLIFQNEKLMLESGSTRELLLLENQHQFLINDKELQLKLTQIEVEKALLKLSINSSKDSWITQIPLYIPKENKLNFGSFTRKLIQNSTGKPSIAELKFSFLQWYSYQCDRIYNQSKQLVVKVAKVVNYKSGKKPLPLQLEVALFNRKMIESDSRGAPIIYSIDRLLEPDSVNKVVLIDEELTIFVDSEQIKDKNFKFLQSVILLIKLKVFQQQQNSKKSQANETIESMDDSNEVLYGWWAHQLFDIESGTLQTGDFEEVLYKPPIAQAFGNRERLKQLNSKIIFSLNELKPKEEGSDDKDKFKKLKNKRALKRKRTQKQRKSEEDYEDEDEIEEEDDDEEEEEKEEEEEEEVAYCNIKLTSLNNYKLPNFVKASYYFLVEDRQLRGQLEHNLQYEDDMFKKPDSKLNSVKLNVAQVARLGMASLREKFKSKIDNLFLVFKFVMAGGGEEGSSNKQKELAWFFHQVVKGGKFRSGKFKELIFQPPVARAFPVTTSKLSKSEIMLEYSVDFRDSDTKDNETGSRQLSKITTSKGNKTQKSGFSGGGDNTSKLQVSDKKKSTGLRAGAAACFLEIIINVVKNYKARKAITASITLMHKQEVMIDEADLKPCHFTYGTESPSIEQLRYNHICYFRINIASLAKKYQNSLEYLTLLFEFTDNQEPFFWYAHSLFKGFNIAQGRFEVQCFEPPVEKETNQEQRDKLGKTLEQLIFTISLCDDMQEDYKQLLQKEQEAKKNEQQIVAQLGLNKKLF